MYRIVVQYSSQNGSKDSVIYEMPPNFNAAKKKSNFLSFSNMINTSSYSTYLIFINASVNHIHNIEAKSKIIFKDSSGKDITSNNFIVESFNFKIIKVNDYISGIKDNLSYICVSKDCSLIHLSLIASENFSNISLEHSHPPQEYIVAENSITNRIKSEAIEKFMENL